MKKLLLSMLMTLLLVAGSANGMSGVIIGDRNAVDAATADVVITEYNTDPIKWVFTDDGTLTISGTGDMPDYRAGNAPWNEHIRAIKTVSIGRH